MELTIQPMKVSKIMLSIIAVLALLHITQVSAFLYIGDKEVFDWIRMLDFDYEGNLPTLYSSGALGLSALLLWVISRHRKQMRQDYRHWLVLCFIFIFLALDEGVVIHEKIGDLTEQYINASGFLYFAWIVPYGILMTVFVLSYLKFLFQLPRNTAIQMVIAGVLFITGAVGLEMFSGVEAELHNTSTIKYTVLYTLEELLEMIAIVIFVNALLKYIGREIGDITLDVQNR
ncbi:hypothetical protein [Thiomicrorhabdus arctica]|uniref:hypothetical protein n=1 Tax=Thiomicrorhabdus arctica TaxID=131540 RepID=UPI0003785877|nr:hypothetical protein [Thiomicrorhabdus arctica]